MTAAFLALPTREDNCPMVVLEAMAAGVPVLASAIGGVPDLIEHEVTGLLCDPDKAGNLPRGRGQIAGGIVHWRSDWRQKLKNAARQTVSPVGGGETTCGHLSGNHRCQHLTRMKSKPKS